jgi:hypothetical protein
MAQQTGQSRRLLVSPHVQLGAPHAVHCKRERHHVYIGRPSQWGNPFIVGEHGTRGECIELYESWLLQHDELMAALPLLRGKVLGCWCAPRACHGDVLVRLANARSQPAVTPAAVPRRPRGAIFGVRQRFV